MDFKDVLEKRRLDAALFINASSSAESHELQYFSDYGGFGALVIPRDKRPFLIVPKMFEEQARKGKIKQVHVLDKKRLFESISDIIKKNKIKFKTIGICFSSFSYQLYKSLRKNLKKTGIKDISSDFLEFRAIKQERELKIIKQGFTIANKVFQKTIRNFSDFKTESDISAFMLYETKKQGCETSFPTIIASGKNASIPHYFEAKSKLNRGLCVIDFGIKHKGYCTDMTRTIAIKSANPFEKNRYDLVLKTQKALVNSAAIGTSCEKLYNECNKLLGKQSKYFTHGLGHGVGVQLHELPNLTLNSKDILKKNMVFTIEPGIYLPGKLGIRIEDTLIAQRKPFILTTPTKELITL